jgi:hypothetical protein
MRTYQKFVRPHGDRALLLSRLKHPERLVEPYPSDAEWTQTLVNDLLTVPEHLAFRERWVRAISAAVGANFNPKHFSFVLHYGQGSVHSHADSMAKTSFLVPLVCTKSLVFFEEYQRAPLAKQSLVRFNDHNDHGIDNPNCASFLVMSISRDLAD